MDIFIRRQSEKLTKYDHTSSNNIFYDRKWEWGFLRKQCRNLELEPFYATYTQRLQKSYLSIFIVIQALIGIAHSIMLLATVNDKTAVFPEIFAYLASILIVWASLLVTFREDLVKRRQWITYVSSFIAIVALVLSDLLIPLYHAMENFPRPPLRPAYGCYILYAVYIFMPLTENWHSFIFGIAITICYLIEFVMVTYQYDDNVWIKTGTEAIFLLCISFFGNYFRLMKEIAIRTAFLDRRECVEENLMLRYAQDQEKSLLLSILPAHTVEILEMDIRKKIQKIKAENLKGAPPDIIASPTGNSVSIKKWRRPQTERPNLDPHEDVSILYADVVNYTYLTTQLAVKPLVETLHELFVKFDQASEEYNVLRIKFLGDCYYCVSGVPIKNDHHAKSCVLLGLKMIQDIREVRSRRNLKIDMRIGVHSGSIISGVIGACKWQYDIWSKDVDIASRLESTGQAGKVHISRQTLELLDGEYLYDVGTEDARKDPILRKYGIETFLIRPTPYLDNKYYTSDDGHRQSIGVRRMLENSRRSKTNDFGVHKHFMQNSIEQYNQIRNQAKLEMSRELDKMPIGKFHLSKFCLGSPKRLTQDELEEQSFKSNVSTVFLFFKEIRWEFLFLMEPDVMLKYSSLIGFLTYLGIVGIQGINKPHGTFFWLINGIAGFILLFFIPLTWFKKLWIVIKEPCEDDPDEYGKPKNKILRLFYNVSHGIMRSITSRTVIYLTIVATLCGSSLLHLLECQQYRDDFKNVTLAGNFEGLEHRLCFNAWALTESLILAICMSFLFVRIPFLFKFIIGLIIVFFYIWVVFVGYPFVYKNSPSTNFGLDPQYAHIFVIILTFGIFHMMDRQTEYISKVDFNWKQQLQKKQEDAAFTNDTIKILLQNILPAHVADIYIGGKMKNDLYTENYENVAIMFATITNYDMEKVGLSVLNRIICDFDEKLMSHDGPLKIEKIKVAGWTYMAACGLDPGRGDSISMAGGGRVTPNQRSSAVLPNGRRSFYNGARNKRCSLEEPQCNGVTENEKERTNERKQSSKNVVYIMTEFALELMKSLQAFNRENFQRDDPNQEEIQNGMLRIGISHGEIMAGVVGSSKPLYDVWGDPVNMASRMDSTGISGKIQVTEETAKVLKSFGIKCRYRGLTFVKGKNYIPTYFVGFDEYYNFIKDQPDYVPERFLEIRTDPSCSTRL